MFPFWGGILGCDKLGYRFFTFRFSAFFVLGIVLGIVLGLVFSLLLCLSNMGYFLLVIRKTTYFGI